jgi:molybdopterin-containing oxidoreductase family membrane subunit
MLLLYLPLVPDLALMRDRFKNIPKWQQKLYAFMANNWQNTYEQKKILNKAVMILTVMIIPVAFGIHTVTSWLFATTLRAGWDSTNFGPYFISGAFMVGAGAVIAAMFVFENSTTSKNILPWIILIKWESCSCFIPGLLVFQCQ